MTLLSFTKTLTLIIKSPLKLSKALWYKLMKKYDWFRSDSLMAVIVSRQPPLASDPLYAQYCFAKYINIL